MGHQRYALPEDASPEQLVELLEEGFDLDTEPVTAVTITYLDTFDWRVHGAGLRLTLEKRNRTTALRMRTAEADSGHVVPASPAVRFAADLPEGRIRNRLAPILEMRALIPVGAIELERQLLRITDDDGNTTARLWFEGVTVLDETGHPADAQRADLRMDGVTGHEPEHSQLRKTIESRLDVTSAPLDDLVAAAAARGREPGDYSSKPRIRLQADQRSDVALRAILTELLTTLEANVDGVVTDIDSEFLHDLRVASRRTRSALAQLKGVLPAKSVATFATEFNWVGTATGPCRDLDVYLLEMDTYRDMLPPRAAAELGPLQELLERSRARVHRRLVTTLRSARFNRLLREWRAFLDHGHDDDPDTPNAGRPVRGLADERILKAYRRIVRRGAKLGDDPPARALHRLRIDAKKLRYLLEFFRSLYPSRRIDSLVRELKRLQDILGGFQDMEVQQERLADFAQQLAAAGTPRAETLLSMGRLEVALEQRQDGFRQAFLGRFNDFASNRAQTTYRKLFGGKRS